MLENDDIKILSPSDASKLELEKNIARQKFLNIPVQVAQSLLDEQMNPNRWQPDFSQGFDLNGLSLTDDCSNDDE